MDIGLRGAGPADSPERGKNADNNFSCQNKNTRESLQCPNQGQESAASQHSAGAK
jgi:hypothetical protein